MSRLLRQWNIGKHFEGRFGPSFGCFSLCPAVKGAGFYWGTALAIACLVAIAAAIFDILTRPAPELSDAERADVKKVARDLLNRLKQLLVLNWRQKSTARSQLKLAIEDVLDTLPAAYDRPLYAQKCSALFEHIYESYPERDAGVYAAAV